MEEGKQMIYKRLEFNVHGDDRGSLIALEQFQSIPSAIKRIYYIYGTKDNVRRGFHAHKKLKQVLICISGHCNLLLDDGYEKTDIFLNKRNIGVYLDRPIWREMYNFSSDAVLLCIASEIYDESDYIRDYSEFLYCIGKEN